MSSDEADEDVGGDWTLGDEAVHEGEFDLSDMLRTLNYEVHVEMPTRNPPGLEEAVSVAATEVEPDHDLRVLQCRVANDAPLPRLRLWSAESKWWQPPFRGMANSMLTGVQVHAFDQLKLWMVLRCKLDATDAVHTLTVEQLASLLTYWRAGRSIHLSPQEDGELILGTLTGPFNMLEDLDLLFIDDNSWDYMWSAADVECAGGSLGKSLKFDERVDLEHEMRSLVMQFRCGVVNRHVYEKLNCSWPGCTCEKPTTHWKTRWLMARWKGFSTAQKMAKERAHPGTTDRLRALEACQLWRWEHGYEQGGGDVLRRVFPSGASAARAAFFAEPGGALLDKALEDHKPPWLNVAALLLARGANWVQPLRRAIYRDDLSTVKFLLSHGATLPEFERGQASLLHCAVHHGMVKMVRYLLDLGMDPNYRFDANPRRTPNDVPPPKASFAPPDDQVSGLTPLHCCMIMTGNASRRSLEVTRMLLAAHADLETVNVGKLPSPANVGRWWENDVACTPLWFACHHSQNGTLIRLLLRRGAKNTFSSSGRACYGPSARKRSDPVSMSWLSSVRQVLDPLPPLWHRTSARIQVKVAKRRPPLDSDFASFDYYYHAQTGAVQWEKPPPPSHLPPGWFEDVDNSGSRFYFRPGEPSSTRWDRPDASLAATWQPPAELTCEPILPPLGPSPEVCLSSLSSPPPPATRPPNAPPIPEPIEGDEEPEAPPDESWEWMSLLPHADIAEPILPRPTATPARPAFWASRPLVPMTAAPPPPPFVPSASPSAQPFLARFLPRAHQVATCTPCELSFPGLIPSQPMVQMAGSSSTPAAPVVLAGLAQELSTAAPAFALTDGSVIARAWRVGVSSQIQEVPAGASKSEKRHIQKRNQEVVARAEKANTAWHAAQREKNRKRMAQARARDDMHMEEGY